MSLCLVVCWCGLLLSAMRCCVLWGVAVFLCISLLSVAFFVVCVRCVVVVIASTVVACCEYTNVVVGV